MTVRPTAEDIETRLRDHIAQLLDAIDDTRRDRIQDMKKMDGDVAALCRQIDALPPQEAARLAEPMAEMIGRLEDLIRELQSFKERAGQRSAQS